jgi:cell division protein ZapA
MADVNLTINGKNYAISCDEGQERRVRDLGHFIDQRMKEIAKAGGGNNESHLFVLTAMMMADELFTMRDNMAFASEQSDDIAARAREEAQIIDAIDELAERINGVASRLRAA